MMRKSLEYRLTEHEKDKYLFEVHGSMDRLFACFVRFDEICDLRDFLNQKIRENPSWHKVEVTDADR